MPLNIDNITPSYDAGRVNKADKSHGNEPENNLRSLTSQFKSGIDDCKTAIVFSRPAEVITHISQTSPELAENLILQGTRTLAALDPRTANLYLG